MRRRLALPLAVAVLVLVGAGAAVANHSFTRWESRQVIFSDRTGWSGWNLATRRAVKAWNDQGANLSIGWVEGGVGCEAAAGVVPICRDDLRPGWRGATNFALANGSLQAASVAFDERRFPQAEMDQLACHEIGHALGLGHSNDPASCITQGSRSTTPSAHDGQTLREMYR